MCEIRFTSYEHLQHANRYIQTLHSRVISDMTHHHYAPTAPFATRTAVESSRAAAGRRKRPRSGTAPGAAWPSRRARARGPRRGASER